ncbi:MAG: S41 family peptidase [Alphaproteobacteria bacterium]|nr:S41 family peptidase [Alphaproteobacteria bacterium]MDY4689178.1 S41 family peptidase [Alphaproteobacteria bacterium]
MLKKSLIAYTLILSLITGCAAAKGKTKPEEISTYELLNLFGEVMERTKMSYVEEVSDKQLIEAAINGMLTSLDPHSSYLNVDDYKYMTEQTKGKFGGLGIQITSDSGLIKVISPIDDTPAAKAGIKAGDYITEVDGETVIGQTLNDVVNKLRGKVGSKVKVTIKRANKKPFTVTLRRAEIKVDSVKSEIKDEDILYIRIPSFNEDLSKNVEKAVKNAQKKLKNKLAGIVIDVRNNPGGLLDQAIGVSDLFLEQGEIVSTRSRNVEDTVKFSATSGDIAKGLPIVVIINEGSASASEILAGALQDHHRAVVIGEKSFGKGSVQTVVQLPNGAGMRLTTARYYTPSGRSIQAKGIEPDIVVKQSKVEEIEDNGWNISEADLKGALKNEQADKKKANKKSKISEADAKDYQLIRAMDLVKALYLYGQNDNLNVQTKQTEKTAGKGKK